MESIPFLKRSVTETPEGSTGLVGQPEEKSSFDQRDAASGFDESREDGMGLGKRMRHALDKEQCRPCHRAFTAPSHPSPAPNPAERLEAWL